MKLRATVPHLCMLMRVAKAAVLLMVLELAGMPALATAERVLIPTRRGQQKF